MTFGIAGLAIGAFVATSTDDFAALVALLTNLETRPSVVFLAKLLSAATLLACACALAMLAFGFSGLPGYVAGLALMATGIAKAWQSTPVAPEPVSNRAQRFGGLGYWLAFTLSGTDNCAAYVSLFAGARGPQIAVGAGTILVSTLLLCIAALATAQRVEALNTGRLLGRLAPCLLILLGIRSLIAPLL
jgi:cadmium resistance protein CadD (predicted permease)